MREIIDTSALFRLDLLERLRGTDRQVVVPAVAFTERARQLNAAGVPPEDFFEFLATNRIEVEPYGTGEALHIRVRIKDRLAWRRLARDAMIAGHVFPRDRLWTSNPRDFLAVGIPGEQIFDPTDPAARPRAEE